MNAPPLPEGDKTPDQWTLPCDAPLERWVKKPLRRVLYPAYLRAINGSLARRYGTLGDLGVDQWYWGHRGLEYDALRRKVHRIRPITGASVLVAGCGTGRDVPSWLPFRPGRIVGVDHFDYSRAWQSIVQTYAGATRMEFLQGDLADLKDLASASFDILGSDAVFEHMRDLPAVLTECHRLLRPGGVLYATFGPLWYCWGGDHISGYDAIASGYNHLLLEPAAYERYLDAAGEFSHSEHDGRTWIRAGLFSRLRPREYLEALAKAGFQKAYVGAVLEPRAIACLQDAARRERLLAENGMLDLIVTGMTIIFRKPGGGQ